jgi:hypothetical protein
VLIVPFGTKGRSIRVRLPREVARWLWRQLGDALGEPKPKPPRQPRLHRVGSAAWRIERRKAPAAVAGNRGQIHKEK